MPTILLANRTEQGSLATPTNTENCDLSYNIDKNKIESIHFKTSSNYKFYMIMSNQIQCKYSSNSNSHQNKPMRISNQCSFLYLVILATSMLSMISTLPSAESFCITQPTTIRSSTQSASSTIFSKPTTNFKTQSTSSIASVTIDSPPSSSASEMSSFQKRMLERMNPTKKKPPMNRNIPANLMKIETLLEYKKVVGGNTDKLIVVRFYAPWCKVRYC